MKELPEGWVRAEIDQVVDVKLGKMLDKAKNRGEPTPYLRNVNVRWGTFDLGDILQMPMSSEERATLSIRDGDVLVCEGGEPGRSALWNGGSTSFTFQKALMRLRPHGGIEPSLLTAYLRWSYDAGELERHFTGTTIKHLPQSVLSRLPIPLPPLPEQRRIVAKIDSLTGKSRRARDHLDHIPRLVEKYKQAVLAAAFRGDLTRSNADVNFETMSLCDIVEPGSPIIYGILQPGPNIPGGVPYVRPTEIVDGRIAVAELRKTSLEIAGRYTRSTLRQGDVLLSIVGTIGKVALVPESLTGGNITQSSCRIRVNSEIALGELVALYLVSAEAKAQFGEMILGTAVHRLNLEDVRRIKIPLPPLKDQEDIIQKVKTAFAWIDRLAGEATSASRLIDRLDQTVLAKAFRGELVPQDPADEPASMLLERIRAERAAVPKTRRGGKASVGSRSFLKQQFGVGD